MADAIGSAICWQVAVTDLAFAAVRAMRRSLFSCQPDSKRSAESASIRSRRFTNQPASSHNLPRRVTWRARLPCPSRSKRGRGLRRAIRCRVPSAFGVSSSVRIVIAHPGKAGSCSGIFVASTKRSTSSTGARLAFAVLTRERNAA